MFAQPCQRAKYNVLGAHGQIYNVAPFPLFDKRGDLPCLTLMETVSPLKHLVLSFSFLFWGTSLLLTSFKNTFLHVCVLCSFVCVVSRRKGSGLRKDDGDTKSSLLKDLLDTLVK